MKKFSTLQSSLFHSFAFLALALFGSGAALRVSGQLFQQDFSSSTTVGNYANAAPTNGQWNTISTSGGGVVTSINTTGSNKLRFASTGANAGSCSRTTDFSPAPSSLIHRFDLTVSGNSVATTNVALWQVGNAFGTANSPEPNGSVYARFAINFGATAGQFLVRDISNGNNSALFSGTQAITWALNNTGSAMTYRAPDGTNESLANDVADIWVGTTRIFNDVAIQTAAQTITDLKFVINTNPNAGTVDMDNFLIDPIPAIPTSAAALPINQNDFQANWSTVAGVTGYSIDVSTSPTFASFVTGYNNLYVPGQATNSLSITGLTASTQYYYRVRGTSLYTVGSFSSGNSATQSPMTAASTSTVVSFAAASATISEGAATYNVTVNITNPSGGQATGVDVVLTSGNAARINGFNSQTISFPASSSTPINVTLTVTDNANCDGSEVLTFSLENLTGGQGTPTVGPARTLTITDNETPSDPVAITANPINYYDFTALWNGVPGATGYFLDVSLYPDFLDPATTNVVTWNFPNGSADITADGGIAANTAKTISTTATGTTGFVSGSQGNPDQAISNNDWTLGNGSKWWQVDFVTTGYAALTVSSKQQSSGTGPRDFKIQYKIGAGGAWTDVPSGAITVANNFTTGVVTNLALPSACDNQASVFLRWIMTSNEDVAVAVQNVALGGTDRIDDIVVNGRAPSLLVNNQPVAGTSQSVTGLTPMTTYYYRVRSTGGCSTGNNSNPITVTTTAVPTYYSRGTGNVTGAIWSDTPGGTAATAIWTSGSNMVVQTGHVVTNTADVQLKSLTLNAGGTLVLNAATTFSVNGTTAAINGTLTANDNSTLALVGNAATAFTTAGTPSIYNLTVTNLGGVTATGNADIRGTLLLNYGNFNASAAAITLRSTATYTGRLGPVAATASYTGNLKVERFIPGGATNWRLLGSPVAGATVNDWQDDFFTAGYPGSAYPNFYDPPGSGIFWPSIRWYDETDPGPGFNDGEVGVSSNSQALVPGQGFAAWSGDNLGGTAPFVIDLNGPPNVANTPIQLPMTWTNVPTGEDGWNWGSNPVPSPILFSSIVRNGSVADYITYYNPAAGNTAQYDISIGPLGAINGGTDTIQSSQGFFLRATGAAPSATVSESAKVVGDEGGFFGGDQEMSASVLRLKVTSAINPYNDETVVLFSTGTPAVDSEDGMKYVFAVPAAPQIATIGGNNELIAINAYGVYTTAISIPVMVDAGVSGTYTVTATGIETLGLTCLSIEDLLTGSITPLTEGASYSFEMDADADASTARLMLHATAPLPFAATDATCGGMANGQATVTVIEGPVDVTWTDGVGTVLLQQNGISGDATFGGLAAGTYAVHVSTNSVCGELVNEFTIDAPFVLEATDLGNTPTTCADTEDGSVDVMVMGGVEPYTYAWSNGADTEDLIAGAGIYTLTVTDANNCVWNSDAYVITAGGAVAGFTVENATVLVNTDVLFTNTSTPGEEYFWEFGDGGTSTGTDPVHIYTLPGTYTVTLTVTSGDCVAVTTFDVTVELNTGISTNRVFGLSAWTSANGFVVEHNFSQRVLIEVLDATGRLQATRQVAGTPGRVTLSTEGLSSGIWFVRVTSGETQQTFRLPLLR